MHYPTNMIANATPFVIPVMKGRKEMFYLTTHSTHFFNAYIALDKW